jgi:hypothetical protein
MKGDFTRISFNPHKQFSRVLMQQGRPQLDADWNEQVAILLESWRNFNLDVLGPHAGPERNCGFAIYADSDFPLPSEVGLSEEEQEHVRRLLDGPGDFLIGPGHYYVEGVRCTNPEFVAYSDQRLFPDAPPLENHGRPYLIYLDVWERHITYVEDDSIREIGLIGADTCSRAKLISQVRGFELASEAENVDCSWVHHEWHELLQHWQPSHRGYLRARAARTSDVASVEPSVISPLSRYHGLTNQLYRVEVHHGGTCASNKRPTFKFSRENGSVIFPITSLADPVVTLATLNRDSRSCLQVGDWVELVDDDYVLRNHAEPLRQVEKIDSGKLQVTLKGGATPVVGQDPEKHPLLRRWDQKQGDPKRGGLELQDGAAAIRESDDGKLWLSLENGVQIQFLESDPPNHYRTGDYWSIPARIASGDVLWPRHEGDPQPTGPQGVRHSYAPLGIVYFEGNELQTGSDCRRKFELQTKY